MLHEYYHYKDSICPDERVSLGNILKANSDTTVHDKPAPGKIANVHIVPWGECKDAMSRIYNIAHLTNINVFGYNVFHYTNFNTVHYNEYSSEDGGRYDWHADATGADKASDMKLTVVADISTEPYEGGEFQVFLNGEDAVPDMGPGSILIFSSWLRHRVTPVTKGVRKSVSFWITGPRLQ